MSWDTSFMSWDTSFMSWDTSFMSWDTFCMSRLTLPHINMKTKKKVDFGAKRESPSPHITSVQYCGGCSVHSRLFSTSRG